jgi:hypothetical protein
MTKTHWEKERKKKKRLAREVRKERESNNKLELNRSPVNLLSERIDKISCRCKAEEMRAGQFCKTCKILTKVNEYMESLLKNASEGRSSIICMQILCSPLQKTAIRGCLQSYERL